MRDLCATRDRKLDHSMFALHPHEVRKVSPRSKKQIVVSHWLEMNEVTVNKIAVDQ